MWLAHLALGSSPTRTTSRGATKPINVETRAPFSGPRDAAKFLVHSGLADSGTILAGPDWLGTAVLPYLPQPTLWYPGRQGPGSYQLWDLHHHTVVERIHPAESLARGLAHFGARPDLVFVTNLQMPDPEIWGWQLVYVGPLPWYHQSESYRIYTRRARPANAG